MRIEKNKIVWTGIKGRNGSGSPIGLRDDEAVEVLNMDFFDGELGGKRAGATAEVLTSGPTTGAESMLVHVPAADETKAELWAFKGTNIYMRPPDPSYAWQTPTVADAPSTGTFVTGTSFNNKLFLAYDSAVNRLHVWDNTSVRRVGMAQGGAASVVNTGAGAYLNVVRYYRVAWASISGSTTLRRGELGPEVNFTPSGAGAAARVTQPAVPNEGETHWLLYGSADQVYSNLKLIATIVVGTTTYDDTTLPSAYVGDAPSIAGINIPPPGARFIISDGNRLLMAGAFEASTASGQTTVKNNRVWFTRVLGSSDIGDDETIPNTAATGLTPAQKNWIDVGENDGGMVTGLGVIDGVIYAFKLRQVWRLVPTGDDLLPYRAINVSRAVGALNHKSILVAEDGSGAPMLYFCGFRGPYRMSVDGRIEYIGGPIEDRWAGSSDQSNVFGVYYGDKRQVWYMVLGAVLADFRIAVFDVGRGGWSVFTIPQAWICAVMYADQVSGGFGNMIAEYDKRPYFSGTNKIVKYDATGATTDDGTTFQAYIQSKPYFPAGLGNRALAHDAVLLAEAASGVTITATLTRDFGLETRTATAILTATGSETRVLRRLEESNLGSLGAMQFTLGDASAIANSWVLDGLVVPFKAQESLS